LPLDDENKLAKNNEENLDKVSDSFSDKDDDE